MQTNQMPMSKCQTRRFTTNPYPPYVSLSEAVVFTGPSYGVCPYLRVRVITIRVFGIRTRPLHLHYSIGEFFLSDFFMDIDVS
jgi:hypothetical protein